MIRVAFIEPETPENIGLIARAMKNFGLNELILVNPKCDYLSNKVFATAMHASEIIRKIKVISSFDNLAKNFNVIVASTAQIGSDYNIPRTPMTVEEFSTKIKTKDFIIVIGRDTIGLKNKEIQKCDFIVTIPTSRKYGTLNASHAAAIIFYELFKKSKKRKIITNVKYASRKEKDIAIKLVNNFLDKTKFKNESKGETQRKLWKRIIGKSFLTKREIYALYGFLKKIK